MSIENRQNAWNERYRQACQAVRPAEVLADNRHLLPDSGRALDLACGLGANALFLAEHGLDTHAWDFAANAVDKLQRRANAAKLPLLAELRDVVRHPPSPDSFDVIVVSHFLERSLIPALIAALRSDGLLYYQTFTKTRPNPDSGPHNPAFLLDDNELLHLFSALRVVVYREEGRIGDCRAGFRNKAMLIAQRRSYA